MAWQSSFQATTPPRGSVMAVATILIIMLFPTTILGGNKKTMNVIDGCWRWDRNWRHHRMRLATCTVGYAGKMTDNIGPNITHYIVTDSGDDALDPKIGTLRYGASKIGGKVWITFQRDMRIKLEKPLLVSSYTAIDGRGAKVDITGGSCITLSKVSNVIIHGLRIHNCKAQEGGGLVMGPEGQIQTLCYADGDAISVYYSRKIWIDHNTLYECEDGLIDVTHGSTDITVSNNWFRSHDMVMLLGHDDAYSEDKNMKVTVVFNYFGPNCDQRMPRVRQGFAHVVNNLYQGWGLYAIGGSMNPSIKSEANLFVASDLGRKEVTGKMFYGKGRSWNFQSHNDVFENGAVFSQIGDVGLKPHYCPRQAFEVADANKVRSLTRSAGVLRCHKRSKC